MRRVNSELDSFWRSDLRSSPSSESLNGREGLSSSLSLRHSLEGGERMSDHLREVAAEKPLYNVRSSPRPASASRQSTNMPSLIPFDEHSLWYYAEHYPNKLLTKDTGRDPFGQSFMKKGDVWVNTPSKRNNVQTAGMGDSRASSSSSKHPASGQRSENKSQLSPGLQALSGEVSQAFSPIKTTPRREKEEHTPSSRRKKTEGPRSPSTRLDLYHRGNVTTFCLNERNFKSSWRSFEEFTAAMDDSKHEGKDEYAVQPSDKHDDECSEAVEIEEVEDLEHDPTIFAENGRLSASSRQDVPRSKSESKLWSPIDRSGSPEQQLNVREAALSALAGDEEAHESPKQKTSPGFVPAMSKYRNYLKSSRARTVPDMLRGVQTQSHLGSPIKNARGSKTDDDLVHKVQNALQTLRNPKATKESIEDVMSTATDLSGLLRNASFHRQKVDALRKQYQELGLTSSH